MGEKSFDLRLQFRYDFLWLTILVHGRLEAFLQTAGSALVPVSLVNGATAFEVTLGLASVHSSSMDASLEESRAT